MDSDHAADVPASAPGVRFLPRLMLAALPRRRHRAVPALPAGAWRPHIQVELQRAGNAISAPLNDAFNLKKGFEIEDAGHTRGVGLCKRPDDAEPVARRGREEEPQARRG